jgi:glyoxylase-like metal-dependent hydrolase (beta-lactamase superfamily II)
MRTRFEVAGMTVDRVIEQEQPLFDPLTFFPDCTPEILAQNRHWMEPDALDPATGMLRLCIQSYVVRTPHHTILIDTCVGNDKPRPGRTFWDHKTDGAYMASLAAAGVTVDDIDYVFCTHLHVDHVGWNTRLVDGRWVPTFPNARYVFSRAELDYWTAQNAAEPIGPIVDSVLPIVAAGRADLVSNDFMLGDHIRLAPTPGHTPDHVAVELLASGGGAAAAVMCGDLIHSPLQALYPEMSMRADTDRAQSARTRRTFLECHCAAQTLVCTAHFPSPSVGRFARAGDAFRFVAE